MYSPIKYVLIYFMSLENHVICSSATADGAGLGFELITCTWKCFSGASP